MYRSKKKIYKGLDLFCGAGGMSLGAINAGINIILAIDNNKAAAETYRCNHPKINFILDDIRNVDLKKEHTDEVFIVFGGPPCQGFSTSNTKTRTLDNPNNFLFKEFLRIVKESNPMWFVFENVEGITKFNNGETVKEIKELFEELGYDTTEKILYASDYGVPQHRNRFFMVGNRLGLKFQFPLRYDYTVSVWDAISDLPDIGNGENTLELPYKNNKSLCDYAKKMRGHSKKSQQNYVSKSKDYVIERYRHIKQGENWRAIPSELMGNYSNPNNCHSGIYKRLNANKPSIVISNYRKNMLIHPFENRGLSVREAARLQSFPDDFLFEGTLMHMQQQIGNAVPPMLAEAIFKQIIKIYKENI